MLVVPVTNIRNIMEESIYIQLLGEGTTVYRPVPAIRLSDTEYKVKGHDIYDPDDEEWEFLPGSIVRVETRILEGKESKVAVEQKQG